MRTRSLIAVAAIAPLLAGAGTAHAAKKPPPKKPTCKLVQDATADGTGTGLGVDGPNDPNFDITYADLATNTKTLTAVIGLATVDGSGSTSPTGRTYDVVFNRGTTAVTIRAMLEPTGNVWAGGKGTGYIDAAKKEIRINVPLSALAVVIKPGDKLTDLKAATWRWAGPDVSLGKVDSAIGVVPYVAGWPSCVKVGL
ncbi:MAG: hypothetical protein QOE45_2433 [Frankiaceae bacterium]|jgi:hypothetical protein|nr:hypothetical protein [Frankiaceae bacterium]